MNLKYRLIAKNTSIDEAIKVMKSKAVKDPNYNPEVDLVQKAFIDIRTMMDVLMK